MEKMDLIDEQRVRYRSNASKPSNGSLSQPRCIRCTTNEMQEYTGVLPVTHKIQGP